MVIVKIDIILCETIYIPPKMNKNMRDRIQLCWFSVVLKLILRKIKI
jgi:hypothetical protein